MNVFPKSVTTPTGITFEHRGGGEYVTKSGGFENLWSRAMEGTVGQSDHALSRPAEQSAWVFAALELLASPVAARPLEWFATAADANAGSSPVSDRDRDAFWSAPFATRFGMHPVGDAATLLITWLKLKGIAYIVLDDDWLAPSRNAQRSPFHIAPPSAMRPIEATRGGEIIGWEYTMPGGRRATLIPAQVIVLVNPNPYDATKGLGAYTAASNAAETDVISGKFARNLAAKNGQQPHYISIPGTITPQQQEQMIASIRDKMQRAADGQMSVGVLTAGATVQEQQTLAVDAAFTSARIENRHEIAAAFGIPMSMFNIAASYSIGAGSDQYRLRTAQNIPLGVKIAAAFAEVEARRRNVRYFAAFDWSGDPVMQAAEAEKQKSAIERTKMLWDMGVPLDDAADVAGLEIEGIPGGDIGYLPFSVQPIEAAPAKDPETPEPVNITPLDKMLELLASRKKLTAKAPSSQGGETISPKVTTGAGLSVTTEGRAPALVKTLTQHGTQTKTPTPPAKSLAEGGEGSVGNSPLASLRLGGENTTVQLGARAAGSKANARLWQIHQATRAKSERKLHGALRKIIGDARAETLRKLDSLDTGKAIQKSGASLALTFSLPDFSSKMTAAVETFGKNTLGTAFAELLQEVNNDNPYLMPPAKAVEFLKSRQNYIKDASKEIHGRIMEEIEQGIGEGNTLAELAGRVKRAFNSVTDGQAFTIARTETSSAYSAARTEAMKQVGATHKQWISARDGNVREEHAAMDGTIVGMDEDFVFDDGTRLSQPCDAGGPPEHVINCRCISVVAMQTPEGEHEDDTLA